MLDEKFLWGSGLDGEAFFVAASLHDFFIDKMGVFTKKKNLPSLPWIHQSEMEKSYVWSNFSFVVFLDSNLSL